MPFITLSPLLTPEQCLENKIDVPAKPDGTGLQILFDINGSRYVIAGPRAGKILTVNGGRIENPAASFIAQHIEELDEETFGQMTITQDAEGIKLQIGDELHALEFLENDTFVDGKKDVYAYVTFTAVCKTASLDQLTQLAEKVTPTANYWNQLGNFLFTHFSAFNKDKSLREQNSFEVYWQSHVETLRALLDKMKLEAVQLDKTLLISPKAALQQKNNEEAFQEIENLATASYAEFNNLFSNTIGRYSERSGYHVFKASDLYNEALAPSDFLVDVAGKKVVAKGIFNAKYVENAYPRLGIQQAAQSLSPRSAQIALNMFQPAPVVNKEIIVVEQNRTSFTN